MTIASGPSIKTQGLVLNLDSFRTDSWDIGQGIWYDISTRLNHANIVSNVFFDQTDGHFEFSNGSAHWVESNSTAGDFNFGTGDFTMEIWIYPNNFTSNTHMMSLGGQNYFALQANTSGNIFVEASGFSSASSITGWTLTANQWNCIAVKRSGNTLYGYKNGELIGSASGYTTNIPDGQFIQLRYGSVAEYSSCNIRTARVYNRALTDEEVFLNYRAFIIREYVPPVVETALTATTVINTVQTQINQDINLTPVIGQGGYRNITYSISPSLPAGFVLNTATGQITGSHGAVVDQNHTVTVTDSLGNTASDTFRLLLETVPITLSRPSLNVKVSANNPFDVIPISAVGGVGSLTYSISPTLPDGIISDTRTWDVIVSGTTEYQFSGTSSGTNPTIVAPIGSTLEFNVSQAANAVIGQEEYTTPGSYTFTVPVGVTEVSAVCIGAGGGGAGGIDGANGGGGGGGGGLAYGLFATTPGENLTVQVGTGGTRGTSAFQNGGAGGDSYIRRGGTTLLQGSGGSGGSSSGGGNNPGGSGGGRSGAALQGGGNGGTGGTGQPFGGGGGAGAGGYSGNGGSQGAGYTSNGNPGAGGGGGSGANTNSITAGGGGGVGILGEGSSGSGGSYEGGGGGGGSGGANGTSGLGANSGGQGGAYGGGGGGAYDGTNADGAIGAGGAVRIIYGPDRSYPSTNVADGQESGKAVGTNPFWIKTAPVAGASSTVTDVTGQGSTEGTVTWDTSNQTPGVYYYVSANTEAMSGPIVLLESGGIVFDSADGSISGLSRQTYPLTQYTITVTDQATPTPQSASEVFNFEVESGPLVATQLLSEVALDLNENANFLPVTGAGGVGLLSYNISPALPTTNFFGQTVVVNVGQGASGYELSGDLVNGVNETIRVQPGATLQFAVDADGVTSGQQDYTTPGSYTFTIPAGVTEISAVAVGAGGYGGDQGSGNGPGGGGGGGGALAYKNAWKVVPGDSMTVEVGAGGTGPSNPGGDSTLSYEGLTLTAGGGSSGGNGSQNSNGGLGGSGGQPSGYFDGGGNGGNGGDGGPNDGDDGNPGSGGGAGGYSGNGGAGINAPSPSANYTANPGTGGGGGSGGPSSGSFEWAAGGGGVGILGEGANGTAGENIGNGTPTAGGGGSGGAAGGSGSGNGDNFGGAYGGGAGGGGGTGGTNTGGSGAVRIIYGIDRSYPSTNTTNQSTTSPAQPFWIKTAATTGTGDAVSGVTNNGTDNGIVEWDTTAVAPGTYYYQSQADAAFGGIIEIVDPANEPTPLTFNTSTGQITGIAYVESPQTTYTVTITDQDTPVASTAQEQFTLSVGSGSGGTVIYDFSEFTFTPGTAIGRTGPDLANLLNSYDTATNSWLTNESYFNMTTQGIQEWTIPATGTYTIRAAGASGTNTNGNVGAGAIMEAEFSLTAGDKLQILAGQQSYYNGSQAWQGGGGGSFVVTEADEPLVIAGGGGTNRSNTTFNSNMNGNTGTSGNNGAGTNGGTNGGPGAFGGHNLNAGGGAGGFVTAGQPHGDRRNLVSGDPDPFPVAQNWAGGSTGGWFDTAYDSGQGSPRSGLHGGFGGGGSGGWGGSGGGGGYSGGGNCSNGNYSGGGGGFISDTAEAGTAKTSDGSFTITGTEPHTAYTGTVENLSAYNSNADGYVTITQTSITGGGGGGGTPALYAFNSFEFTSPINGPSGPTLTELTNSYDTASNPWLLDTNYFNVVTQGVQQWTVPATGTYRFTALGATGGIHGGSFNPAFPGAGATVVSEIPLTSGQVLNIVVGQKPSSITSSSGNGAGGGGGTWVYEGTIGGTGLILVAGGGGGTGHGSNSSTGGNGKGGSDQATSNEATAGETFGVNTRAANRSCGNNGLGQGGKSTSTGGNTQQYNGSGGGAGWFSDGDSHPSNGQGGTRWVGGSSEDGVAMAGGFGGGGGAGGNGNAAGGGGGYTGGGAGDGYTNPGTGTSWGAGAGGGSIVQATGAQNTTITVGASGINYADTRNGSLLIEKL